MFNSNESADLLLDEVDTVDPLSDEELEGDDDDEDNLDVDSAGWDKDDSE